ncbi:hypothetical protein ACFX10_028428 [Malus domestica]
MQDEGVGDGESGACPNFSSSSSSSCWEHLQFLSISNYTDVSSDEFSFEINKPQRRAAMAEFNFISVVSRTERVLRQVIEQLNKLVNVIKVEDISNEPQVGRELVLIVEILGRWLLCKEI